MAGFGKPRRTACGLSIPVRARCDYCLRYGGGLQPEPGSVLRFYPASRPVLIDRWPAFRAADYATERGSCIGAVSGWFEREQLPDLSRRVCDGTWAQRDVCV